MAEKMNVEIGKYTLESLTTGMYSDPMIVYREYIQNSVDSLESAVEKGIIEEQNMRIDIMINKKMKSITFKDNGTGIPKAIAKSMLLNIGNSQKQHFNNRGFRGIGRLGGMSYCDMLIFTTSFEGEIVKTILTFDCKRLRELLVPGSYEHYNLSSVINEITTVEIFEEEENDHYFWAEMKGVSDYDNLLCVSDAKTYISQVAPVPYKLKAFYMSNEVKDYMFSKGYKIEEFPIFIGEDEAHLQPTYKPNKNGFHADRNKMKKSNINKIRFFDIIVDGEIYAAGWYADCEWLGTISESEISGFRVRKGNILIGDAKTLSRIFREPRFNGWVQGEIFILTDKLIPNARRDDFEQNTAHRKFVENLSEGIGLTITKAIREASSIRNDNAFKVILEVEKKVEAAETALIQGFNSAVDKSKMLEILEQTSDKLKGIKVRDDLKEDKENLKKRLSETIEKVSESSNYKINQIKSGVDRKSKKVLEIVSDILSVKLSKFLVDEILGEIIDVLNRK